MLFPHSIERTIGRALTVAAAILALGLSALAATAITDMTINRAVVEELSSSPRTSIEALAIAPDSRTLACGLSDGRLILLDVQSRSTVRSLALHEAPITARSFSPEGTWFASSDLKGRLVVWDVAAGDVETSWDLGRAVHDVDFSPLGTWLLCSGAIRSILRWETKTWRSLDPLVGHSGRVYSFAVSPQEDPLVTGAGDDDPSIRVWSLPEGSALPRDDLYEGRIHDIEYSPKDPHTCIAGTQRVWLWEVDRGDYWHLTGYYLGDVYDLAYSSRGNAIVTACEDGSIQFLRVPSWYVRRKTGSDQPMTAVDYSENRLTIVCGDAAGTLFVLTTP